MYNRTFWLDHVTDGSGNVIQQGTNLSQDNFNKIELGVFEAGIEQDINAILNNLNAQEAAEAAPYIMANQSLSSGANTIAFPTGHGRNNAAYAVIPVVTDSSGATVSITAINTQANGFTATASGACKATFIVVGGVL